MVKLLLKFIFIINIITDVSHFPSPPPFSFHPSPTPPQAFTTLLSASLGCAYMPMSSSFKDNWLAKVISLVNDWNWDGHSVFWWQGYWLCTCIITSYFSFQKWESTSELMSPVLECSMISLFWCILHLQMNWLGIAMVLGSDRFWFWRGHFIFTDGV